MLQCSHVRILRAKVIFQTINQIIDQKFAYKGTHISYPSAIIHSPDFEIDVVKVVTGREGSLTPSEENALKKRLRPVEEQDVVVERGLESSNCSSISIPVLKTRR
ncbi:hypothetical protein GEMRC1_005623 [Eukaryota sp. GEM-RC1]